jgi:hypothetical protein
MKIFSLPKTATQSPREARLIDFHQSRACRRVSIDQGANSRNNCSTGAFCIPTIFRAAFSRGIRIIARVHCRVVDRRASRARTPPSQHFLKQDSVFFDALVYSGCSAFRFPSARSDQVISKSGGQHGQES